MSYLNCHGLVDLAASMYTIGRLLYIVRLLENPIPNSVLLKPYLKTSKASTALAD